MTHSLGQNEAYHKTLKEERHSLKEEIDVRINSQLQIRKSSRYEKSNTNYANLEIKEKSMKGQIYLRKLMY